MLSSFFCLQAPATDRMPNPRTAAASPSLGSSSLAAVAVHPLFPQDPVLNSYAFCSIMAINQRDTRSWSRAISGVGFLVGRDQPIAMAAIGPVIAGGDRAGFIVTVSRQSINGTAVLQDCRIVLAASAPNISTFCAGSSASRWWMLRGDPTRPQP